MNPSIPSHAAAVGALATLALLAGCAREAPPAPPLPAVFVSTVRNDSGAALRQLSGSVRPRVESELAFRTGGKVVARQVDIGQTVRADQVLARLDPADVQLGVDVAAEQLRAAEVDATQAASDAARFKRLLADGSVGAADQERQQARADAAAARRSQAQRQLDLQRNRAGYAVLTAPFDGVVTALRFETGQAVAEGQAVLTLARPGELEVVVDVPEALAPTLRQHKAMAQVVGLPAPVTLKLRELAPAAAAQTRTFRARFAIVSPPAGLRMGSTAELRLSRDGAQPSAELPSGALLQAGGAPGMWLVDEKTGALKRQPVQLISQTTDQVRVAGLADGALVVSVGAQKLDAGLRVRVVRRPLEAMAHANDINSARNANGTNGMNATTSIDGSRP